TVPARRPRRPRSASRHLPPPEVTVAGPTRSAQVAPEHLDRADRGQGGRLRAQDARAESGGNETRGGGLRELRVLPTPGRSDQHQDALRAGQGGEGRGPTPLQEEELEPVEGLGQQRGQGDGGRDQGYHRAAALLGG